jgi:hypothetical protein
VRVPEAVGTGRVRITLSFDDWKEGHVSPATFQIPLQEERKKEGKEE